MAAVHEKVNEKILQLTICLSFTSFVSGDYFSPWNHNFDIPTIQLWNFNTLPKVIIGTLFLSHSLREMDVSGVKLKHVNMFRQVPQTLLEFLDHCFRQHAASLWVETSHPKDTGQSIKSWKISRSSQQCASWMNSSSFPGLLRQFSIGFRWSHCTRRFPIVFLVRKLSCTVYYAVYLFFGKINQNGSDKRCKKTHNVLISAKNAPYFE